MFSRELFGFLWGVLLASLLSVTVTPLGCAAGAGPGVREVVDFVIDDCALIPEIPQAECELAKNSKELLHKLLGARRASAAAAKAHPSSAPSSSSARAPAPASAAPVGSR